MGVDHGGTGDANTNCPPPRFCHIGTKMSVLWPSKYAKIRFRPGLRPRPRWGSSRRSPRPLSRLERGHLWRSPCVPHKSSQIYAYDLALGDETAIPSDSVSTLMSSPHKYHWTVDTTRSTQIYFIEILSTLQKQN